MGKSSLMVRAAARLRSDGAAVAVLDLTGIGVNVTAEQWYDGLLARVAASPLGRSLDLEDALDEFWMDHSRLSPVQRFFSALREVALPRVRRRLIVFFDELDMVRGLPFSTLEFFAALRHCENLRLEDPVYQKLGFCLLGVATPAELIQDPDATPFQVGSRVALFDFTLEEAMGLAAGFGASGLDENFARDLVRWAHHWTRGHPYLTQRLCQEIAARLDSVPPGQRDARALAEEACEQTFLSSRACETDDNLLYVRERVRRSAVDRVTLLELYERVWNGDPVPDREGDAFRDELRLLGLVREEQGRLVVRNRIYHRVFNGEWIRRVRPLAELEMEDGSRVPLRDNCVVGRSDACDLCLPNPRVSRRHALIRKENNRDLWLIDADSRNGTYLNRRRVTEPVLLRHMDRLQIGPFSLVFHQPGGPPRDADEGGSREKTVFDL